MSHLFLGAASLFFLFFNNPRQSTEAKNEGHLRNVRQLTFGDTNAEAYFSFDNKRIVFKSTRSPHECDQIFTMNFDGSEQKLASTGKGVTTCGYFFPDGRRILYASTHGKGDQCYPRPDKSKGYVWGVWNAYDIYTSNPDGSDIKVLSATGGYDAEATISPAGNKIIFTSSRDGDLDLYTMNLDGSGVTRVTNELGYDGGAFFSWDGKRIVYRAFHHKDSSAVADDKRIIFASNSQDPKGRMFHLYLMNDDGSGREQITFDGHFNAFPMFTRGGKHVIFVSDRNAKGSYEFNIFIADWVD